MISVYPAGILHPGGDLFNFVPGVGVSMRVIAKFLATVLFVFLTVPASAAVMTFKDLPFLNPFLTEYRENGITMTGDGDLGHFGLSGTAHLDDSGTSFAQFLTFTTGRRFNAVQFDIFPLGTDFCADGGSGACNDPYDNVSVQGFRGGAVVAEDIFFGGENLNTYVFGADYSNLDQLVIGALLPNAALGGFCIDAPCGHFSIDNVELSAVPLPAALPLFSAALGLLGFLGWRRRRTGGAIA